MASVGILASEEGAPEGIKLFIPPINELVWGTIMFTIVFLLFWKYVLPRMQEVLDARTEGIEKKLEKAEADRAEAQRLLEEYRQQLAHAREEAASIRAKAQSDRQSIVAEARGEAEAAARTVTEQATARMEADVSRVKSQLSRDVGRIATELAEKIVKTNLDSDPRVSATVDAFVADLENATADTAGRN